MTHYKSIFVSDLHLGARGSKADDFCAFMKHNTAENLFLVGDIVDGWQLKRRWFFPQSHVNAIRRIFTAAKRGSNVRYILGNHDEMGRSYLQYDISFGRIKIMDSFDYEAVNGKRYLIIHGDIFDPLMVSNKWLMHLGDAAYNVSIWINVKFNKIRRMLGFPYWSLSNWLKQNTKQAANFIHDYEDRVASYCKERDYDGIICGHIHVAEMRTIDGIEYINCGDWVESGTAIVEDHNGNFHLIKYEGNHEDSSDN